MPDFTIEELSKIVTPFNIDVARANRRHAALFENDLNETDKYDLGRTWRNDWRAELYATLENSTSTFIFSSVLHRGFAIFGVNSVMPGCAQIWLLQSRSFGDDVAKYRGREWVYQFVLMSRAIIELCLGQYPLLFNFISGRQSQNIRWLKSCGFEFFGRRDISTDMLLFGQGSSIQRFAAEEKIWRAFLGEAI